MTDRAISTVLDASVCLLLVAASALTLAGAPVAEPTRPDLADETLETLTTSTAQVNYTAGASAETRIKRTAHGTLARLLADATLATLQAGDEPVTKNAAFEGAVTTEVASAVGRPAASWRGSPSGVHSPSGVQVLARWKPYPGSTLGGQVVAGRTPPAETDVHAASVTVSSGLPDVEQRAVRAAHDDGFDGVAHVVASAVVRGLFDPQQARRALQAGETRPERAALTTARYHTAAETLGATAAVERALAPASARSTANVSTERVSAGRVSTANVSAANRALTAALAAVVETQLREQYDSPAAAAEATTVGEIRVTVRTWSR